MSDAVIHVHRGGPLVALVGNPNCGKTALFNRLTGSQQKVANYAGVTVERKEGRLTTFAGKALRLLDLPGAYSLHPRSPDEAVTVNVLRGHAEGEKRPDAVVCVVDATNLRRHLRLPRRRSPKPNQKLHRRRSNRLRQSPGHRDRRRCRHRSQVWSTRWSTICPMSVPDWACWYSSARWRYAPSSGAATPNPTPKNLVLRGLALGSRERQLDPHIPELNPISPTRVRRRTLPRKSIR